MIEDEVVCVWDPSIPRKIRLITSGSYFVTNYSPIFASTAMSGIVAAVAQKKAQQKTPGTAQRRDASSKESRNLIGINSPSSGVKNKFVNNQDGPMNGKMKKADLEAMITAAQDGAELTQEEKSFLQRVGDANPGGPPEACNPAAVDAIVACWAAWMASREQINAVFSKNLGGQDAMPPAALKSVIQVLNGEAASDGNMVRQVSGGLIRQVSGEGPKVGDNDAEWVVAQATTLAGKGGTPAAIDQKIAIAMWYCNVESSGGGCCVIS